MSKKEFLEQLEKLLSDLPEEERREAMEFYVEYFDEAGPEEEQDVVKKFGSPKEVADRIHEELAEKGVIGYDSNGNNTSGEEKKNVWKTVGIVVLCIFAAPILIPLVVAVISAVISAILAVISAILGVFLGFCGVTLAFAVVAIVLFVTGIMKLFTSPLVGAFLIGLALLFAGISLLLGFAVWKFCVVALPWMFRGICSLWNKIFDKKGEEV